MLSDDSKRKAVVPLPFPPDKLRCLLWFMQERQTIYIRRQAGKPFPWTADPILKDFRLENVYREQDRETVALRNWLRPYADHPNLWFACCMFRAINWSPTLQEIGFPEEWNPEKVLQVLQSRMARGLKTYTSAYRIHQRDKKTRPEATIGVYLDPLWKAVAAGNRPVWETGGPVSLESAHRWLGQFYGWGLGFLTYEAVTDLRHTRYLQNATDINTWANPGPGAARGICRLLGVDLETKISRPENIRYIRQVFRWIEQNRDRSTLPTLEMRDVEHSLCAYDKWRRAHERLRASQPVTLERFTPPRRNLFGGFVRSA